MKKIKKPRGTPKGADWEKIANEWIWFGCALKDIAGMDKGIEGVKNQLDFWAATGKNAVYLAQKALADKCPRCGK